ncbi:MAG: hypothetical protein LBN95_13825 [Prevotellaceae bacterium]|jgi:guanylate kinase|nr:hypothetical protein [Prevotellaceae bacterium]
MKITPINKLFFLHKKQLNKTISEKELLEYNSIIQNYDTSDKELNDIVKDCGGYNKTNSYSFAVKHTFKKGDNKSIMVLCFICIILAINCTLSKKIKN